MEPDITSIENRVWHPVYGVTWIRLFDKCSINSGQYATQFECPFWYHETLYPISFYIYFMTYKYNMHLTLNCNIPFSSRQVKICTTRKCVRLMSRSLRNMNISTTFCICLSYKNAFQEKNILMFYKSQFTCQLKGENCIPLICIHKESIKLI